MVRSRTPAVSSRSAIRSSSGPSSWRQSRRLWSPKPSARGLSRCSRCESTIRAGMAIQQWGWTKRSFQMYATIRPNIRSGSRMASLRIAGSKEEVLGPIHQHVQGRGRKDSGGLAENPAVGHTGDGAENHVAPVGQGLGSVVEVCTAENEGGGQQRAGARAEAEREQILDE